MLSETPTSTPEIPTHWKTCKVFIWSATVWNDHSAFRAGIDAGVIVSVSTTPNGEQKFTIVRTDRYDPKKFPSVLEELKEDAFKIDVIFE